MPLDASRGRPDQEIAGGRPDDRNRGLHTGKPIVDDPMVARLRARGYAIDFTPSYGKIAAPPATRGVAERGIDRKLERERNVPRGQVNPIVEGQNYNIVGFDIGSAALSKPGFKEQLDPLVREILGASGQNGSPTVRVTGHASDSRFPGKGPQTYSADRARAIKEYLMSRGVPGAWIVTDTSRAPGSSASTRHDDSQSAKSNARSATVEISRPDSTRGVANRYGDRSNYVIGKPRLRLPDWPGWPSFEPFERTGKKVSEASLYGLGELLGFSATGVAAALALEQEALEALVAATQLLPGKQTRKDVLEAYKRLSRKLELSLKEITPKELRRPGYEYQVRKTGKRYEYVLKEGDKIYKLDDIVPSLDHPGKLSLVDTKFSRYDLDSIGDSPHVKYSDSKRYKKVEQLIRYAKLVKAHPGELGEIIIKGNSKAVLEIFKNIIVEDVPEALQQFIHLALDP